MKFWMIMVMAVWGTLTTWVAVRACGDDVDTRKMLVIMLAGQGVNVVGAAMGLATNATKKKRPPKTPTNKTTLSIATPTPVVPGKGLDGK
jgi:Na+/glutamate symporter